MPYVINGEETSANWKWDPGPYYRTLKRIYTIYVQS